MPKRLYRVKYNRYFVEEVQVQRMEVAFSSLYFIVRQDVKKLIATFHSDEMLNLWPPFSVDILSGLQWTVGHAAWREKDAFSNLCELGP